MTYFFVNGKPSPQGSKSVSRTGHLYESSAGVKNWRKRIYATAQLHRSRDAAIFPTQALSVRLMFVLPRPKYALGKRLAAVKRNGDIDKLTRAVFDGLTHVCYGDDAQIVHMAVRKRLAMPGEEIGVHVHYELDNVHLDPTQERAIAP